MSNLNDIAPSTDTVLTDELKRLFLYAGCDPACHACGRRIKVGDTFKLTPHKKAAGWEPEGERRDEMCCAKCGEPELLKRDKRSDAERTKRYYSSGSARSGVRVGGGYSRLSKAAL